MEIDVQDGPRRQGEIHPETQRDGADLNRCFLCGSNRRKSDTALENFCLSTHWVVSEIPPEVRKKIPRTQPSGQDRS